MKGQPPDSTLCSATYARRVVPVRCNTGRAEEYLRHEVRRLPPIRPCFCRSRRVGFEPMIPGRYQTVQDNTGITSTRHRPATADEARSEVTVPFGKSRRRSGLSQRGLPSSAEEAALHQGKPGPARRPIPVGCSFRISNRLPPSPQQCQTAEGEQSEGHRLGDGSDPEAVNGGLARRVPVLPGAESRRNEGGRPKSSRRPTSTSADYSSSGPNELSLLNGDEELTWKVYCR
jgi:hypothetical protein